MLKKIYESILKGLEIINGIFLLAMCLIIILQVFCRFVIFHSLSWSEETCRYLYIWLVILGVLFGIRDHSQTKIDVLDTFLRGKSILWVEIFRNVISLIAVVAIGISAFPLIENGWGTKSATLGFPMAIVYFVFPFGMTLTAIQLVLSTIGLIRQLGKESERA